MGGLLWPSSLDPNFYELDIDNDSMAYGSPFTQYFDSTWMRAAATPQYHAIEHCYGLPHQESQQVVVSDSNDLLDSLSGPPNARYMDPALASRNNMYKVSIPPEGRVSMKTSPNIGPCSPTGRIAGFGETISPSTTFETPFPSSGPVHGSEAVFDRYMNRILSPQDHRCHHRIRQLSTEEKKQYALVRHRGACGKHKSMKKKVRRDTRKNKPVVNLLLMLLFFPPFQCRCHVQDTTDHDQLATGSTGTSSHQVISPSRTDSPTGHQ